MPKIVCALVIAASLSACGQGTPPGPELAAARPAEPVDNTPPLDPQNIVSIASRSADHSTLVAALRAADYVTGVSNPGPLTVFAPTNAAFEALPPGTVENLIKPENVSQLRHILQHHVVTSSYSRESLRDGQDFGMVDGTHAIIHITGDRAMIDTANIVASIPASNGTIHVIDKVLLPPAAPAAP